MLQGVVISSIQCEMHLKDSLEPVVTRDAKKSEQILLRAVKMFSEI